MEEGKRLTQVSSKLASIDTSKLRHPAFPHITQILAFDRMHRDDDNNSTRALHGR